MPILVRMPLSDWESRFPQKQEHRFRSKHTCELLSTLRANLLIFMPHFLVPFD